MSQSAVARLHEHWGEVPDSWRWLAEQDPDWVAAFCDFLDATDTGALAPSDRELLFVAAYAAVTTADEESTKRHIRRALDLGATTRHVLDTLELVSMLGMHSVIDGLDAMTAQFPDRSPAPSSSPLREKYLDGHGYWRNFDGFFPGFHDAFIAASPELFESYQVMGAATWKRGVLQPWLRELMFVVMDLSSTHLYINGAALHANNALHYGATEEQVLEALRVSTVVSSRTVTLGIDALRAVLDR